MVYLFKFNVLTGLGADIVSTTTPALVVLLGMVFWLAFWLDTVLKIRKYIFRLSSQNNYFTVLS